MNILTGLQATGALHIGNYFGSIKQLIDKSNSIVDEDNIYLFVPDLHSLTIDVDYKSFSSSVLETVKIYLASGLKTDKKNIITFRQSRVAAHSQMMWLLSCFSYFGEMKKMTQFKDKSADNNANVNVGLFTYPILMAGDIFLYDVEYVPVGHDQTQHLELARNLAIRINNKFGQNIFTVPKKTVDQSTFFNLEKPLNVLSLTNPLKKMSKSNPDEYHKILLTDTPELATKKIMSSATDSLQCINWDWENQPGITNLLQILSLVSGQSVDEVVQTWKGKTMYGEFKKTVANEVSKFLTEFRQNYAKITDNQVLDALKCGEEKANLKANEVLERFQKHLGLYQ